MFRWGWLTRAGLPDLGLPHQSPEQERVVGRNCCDITEDKTLPEDIITANVVSGLSDEHKEIARLRWKLLLNQTDIARRTGLTRRKIRTRLHWIKEQVIDATQL